MPTYTRDGVEAAARLAALEGDVSVWERVEEQYDQMLRKKGGSQLCDLDLFCNDLASKLCAMENPSISKADLLQIVKWKFAKGKPRNALMKYLQANSDSEVRECSRASFSEAAKNDDMRAAICKMSKLKGVGPATASALLSLFRPDIFSFMDDEVIECLYEGKRGYTEKIYLHINNKCIVLANNLGDGWTPRRVGRALWTAARIQACGGNDFTIATKTGTSKAKTKRAASEARTSSKRQKK